MNKPSKNDDDAIVGAASAAVVLSSDKVGRIGFVNETRPFCTLVSQVSRIIDAFVSLRTNGVDHFDQTYAVLGVPKVHFLRPLCCVVNTALLPTPVGNDVHYFARLVIEFSR